MVICLERGADLHMAKLMPLPLAVSCFSKIRIGFTFLVPAHPCSPGKRAVKRVSVCVNRLLSQQNCSCNCGICIVPPSGRPRAHHKAIVSLYPVVRRQTGPEMFLADDKKRWSTATASAGSTNIHEIKT